MHWRSARGRGGSRTLLAAAIGAGLAFFFDPVQGGRRRALLHDGVGRRARRVAELGGKAGRDLRQRAAGLVAEARAAVASEGPVDDRVLRDRVRSQIGRVVSNPGAIEVEAREGCVTLRGRVARSERDELVREASSVRGVRTVTSQLENAGPDLQRHARPARRGSFAQTPLARLAFGGLAAAAAVWATARTGLLIPALAVGGVALAARRAGGRISRGDGARGERRGACGSASGRGGRSMATKIQDVMTREVVALQPDATAQQAARLMKEHDIGDVLVCEGERLRGIVTDRDLVIRCLAEDDRPTERRVGEICSGEPVRLSPQDDVDRAVELMRQHAVRRIPVVEGDRPVGVVSIGDLAMERDERSALADISAAPANQ
ncbi:MAG: hypothetical protein DCC71_07245 [Proteobacteria bacterium]|nr:MAG: hypothetical protein DCC71_07245 [Pseudomonadota bacterium]